MKPVRNFILAIMAGFSLAAQVAAEPLATLETTQEQLRVSQRHFTELRKDAAGLEIDLTRLQKKLVDLAEAARKREQRLLELEKDHAVLTLKIKTSNADLVNRREEVADLLQSLIRLSRTPPEAVIAMPGELRHTLQAAQLLQATTRHLQQKTRELTLRLDRLRQATEALEKNRLTLLEEKRKTEAVRQTLAAQAKERKALFARLNRQQAQEQDKIDKLTRQSQNMRQLITKLEEERKRQSAASAHLTALPRAKPMPPAQRAAPLARIVEPLIVPAGKSTSFTAARGKLALPVAGFVTGHFGERNGKKEASKGLTIASREGNAILAPYGGEVVFTGPFLDYGQMVILRYDGDYHLLLAGFSQIDCVTGQRIMAGEPLGRVSRTLYLELRKSGKPTNPAPWFG